MGGYLLRKVIILKYVNTRTGLIFEDDNVEYVLKLIEEKEHIILYEEEKPPIVEVEKTDIIRYVQKPKRKPKQTKVGD